jgi:hypothetical protein
MPENNDLLDRRIFSVASTVWHLTITGSFFYFSYLCAIQDAKLNHQSCNVNCKILLNLVGDGFEALMGMEAFFILQVCS